jgi:dTDP-4-dehydrorhamnose reductase
MHAHTDAEHRLPRPLLITGARGTLGRAFARLCVERGLAHHALGRQELDVAEPAQMAAALDAYRPWAVVNAAGYVRVDDAERDRERCFRENARGPALLAELCAERGIALATFSSDLVFDGLQGAPYVESSAPSPLNAYGESKAEAERLVLAALPSALVVRTSAFFGPWDEHNFVTLALRALAAGIPFAASDDAVVSPTYVPDLVHATLDLLIDGESGVWHLANEGSLAWAELARRAAAAAGLDPALVEGRATATLGLAARRPAYSALASERGRLMPSVENAICRYVGACAPRAGCAHRPFDHQHRASPGAAEVGGAA